MKKNRLIIFTRYPEPGKVKTRLIPVFGPEKSAMIHRQLSEYTFKKAKELAELFPLDVQVYYEGGSSLEMDNWLENIVNRRQIKGCLGEKMSEAFRCSFHERVEKVVIIGTDCPDLSNDIIKDAFSRLSLHDIVLGPAEDGGYYLIGLKKEHDSIFRDIPWGTGAVLEKTKKRALVSGLSTTYLPTLKDVDRPEDVEFFEVKGER